MQRLILALVLATAACGGTGTETNETVSSTSMTVTSPSSTSTTTAPTTTTSTALTGPIGMSPGTNTFFDPGAAYRAEFLPLETHFRFEQPGWRTVTVQPPEGFILFSNPDTGLPEPLSLGLKFTSNTQTETVDRLVSDENVFETTGLTTTSLGGLSAVTFDVTVPPTYDVGPTPCTGAVTLVNFGTAETGPFAHGLLGCARNRVWVADSSGQSIIVYVGLATEDDANIAQLDAVEPLLDDFVNAITFCTEDTPCDD